MIGDCCNCGCDIKGDDDYFFFEDYSAMACEDCVDVIEHTTESVGTYVSTSFQEYYV